MINARSLNGPFEKADTALTKAIKDANAEGKHEITFNVDSFFRNEPSVRNQFLETVRDSGYEWSWVVHPTFGYATDFVRIKW